MELGYIASGFAVGLLAGSKRFSAVWSQRGAGPSLDSRVVKVIRAINRHFVASIFAVAILGSLAILTGINVTPSAANTGDAHWTLDHLVFSLLLGSLPGMWIGNHGSARIQDQIRHCRHDGGYSVLKFVSVKVA